MQNIVQKVVNLFNFENTRKPLEWFCLCLLWSKTQVIFDLNVLFIIYIHISRILRLSLAHVAPTKPTSQYEGAGLMLFYSVLKFPLCPQINPLICNFRITKKWCVEMGLSNQCSYHCSIDRKKSPPENENLSSRWYRRRHCLGTDAKLSWKKIRRNDYI